MNALKARKKYDAEQREKAYEEWKRQKEEKIRNMTEEERAEYLKEEKRKNEKIASLISFIGVVNSIGPYGFEKGKRERKK